MSKRLTALLLAASLIFGGATTSFAASKAKKIDTARSAPLSLVEAIELVEQRMKGSVYEAELDRKSKRDIYEMYVVVNSSVYEVYVDIRNGKLIKQSLENKKPVRLGKPLTEIIQIATNKQPGVPYEVECKTKKKKPVCEIEVVANNDDVYEITIDGNTGDILSLELD